MTIDEAIEHEKELVKVYRCVYECECDFYGSMFVHDNSDRFDCVKDMRAHEQLAEWLEELKAYMEIGTVEECMNSVLDIPKAYNKGIDDFVKFASGMPTVETEDGTIRPMWLEEMAEKLKEKYNK